MARLNVRQREYTHEGAPATSGLSIEQQLRRSVLACLLWEDSFYEAGESIADRIWKLCEYARPNTIASLAVEARTRFKLRHVPLLLLCGLAPKQGRVVGDTVAEVIQRPDELGELLAIYWRNGKRPISKQLKLGLARAFNKFDEYQLAKYDRPGNVRLRDVMFLTHPKPKDEALFKRIAEQELQTPDTWEVALSGGGDKKASFERLLSEEKLGYLALLRNLRNMEEANVDRSLIRDAILARKGAARVLPFRYLMAARMVPSFEKELDRALRAAINDAVTFEDETLVLVDTSGSMSGTISGKSRVRRVDAAAMLGALVDGNVRCFAFATDCLEVPHRLGIAGVDAFQIGHVGHGTNIGHAVQYAERRYPNAARLIVVTDEQSHDVVADALTPRAYMINVAAYQNGVGYGRWTHIDGFSEATLRYIAETEALR